MKRPSVDFLLNAGSAVLAFACAFFAGLMILHRQNFEDARLKVARTREIITRDDRIGTLAADPDITGSVTPRFGGIPIPREPGPPQVMDFKLLTVVDGVAFVQIDGPQGRELWPVSEGSVLPGAGRVVRITRSNDRWQVTASHYTITSER